MWIIVNNTKIVAVEQSQFETAPNFGDSIEVADTENPQIGYGYIDGAIVYPAPPSYSDLRLREYPSFADQFDTLYHGGYDAWKAQIDAIKAKYPKP